MALFARATSAVTDSLLRATAVKAVLVELPGELADVGKAERYPLVFQQVEMHERLTVARVVKIYEPLLDFWFELNCTQGYNTDGMARALGISVCHAEAST
jgi:hypothetical protein